MRVFECVERGGCGWEGGTPQWNDVEGFSCPSCDGNIEEID